MKQLQQIWEKFKLVKQVPTTSVGQKAVNPQSSPRTIVAPSNLANIKKEHVEKTNDKEDNSYPYMKFDFNEDPRTIASKMVEGFNVPGFGKPIPVRSFKMPIGWVKYVSVRFGGQNRGKWEPYVCELKTGKNFYHAAKLGNYLSETGSKHQIKEFDLTLDDNLRTLRLIWQKFKMPQNEPAQPPAPVVQAKANPLPPPISSPQAVRTTAKDQKAKSYLDFNLNKKADLIAEEMVEGVNIPGIDVPISIDCPNLPQGWKKFAQQKLKGTSKLDFDWIVYVQHMDSKKSIYNEIEMEQYLKRNNLTHLLDKFDFSLGPRLRTLKKIWRKYKVKPFVENAPTETQNLSCAGCNKAFKYASYFQKQWKNAAKTLRYKWPLTKGNSMNTNNAENHLQASITGPC